MTDLTASSASSSSSTRAGVLLMLLSMMMFALNDVLGKWLVSTYSAPQLMLIRSVAAVAVLLPFFWRSGWRSLVKVERPRLQALRALLCAVEATAFYYVVGHMPLADTITYWLAAPIYVAALSPLMLGERVGWRRWTAILVGFAGVVVALEPSAASFTLPALVALIVLVAGGVALDRQTNVLDEERARAVVLAQVSLIRAKLEGTATSPEGATLARIASTGTSTGK